MFPIRPIHIKLEELDENHLKNKELIKSLINAGCIFSGCHLAEIYKYDLSMHSVLAKGFNKTNIYKIDDFLTTLNRTSRDDVLEFASINPIFIDSLTDVEKEVFFENEILSIEDININKYKELIIKTSFGEFCYMQPTDWPLGEGFFAFRPINFDCNIENEKNRFYMVSKYAYKLDYNNTFNQEEEEMFKREVNKFLNCTDKIKGTNIKNFMQNLYNFIQEKEKVVEEIR
jgi:hypothetical protein